MYSFLYTSKFSQNGKDDFLLHILLDGSIIESQFVQFNSGTDESVLNDFALSKIAAIQDLANGE